MTEGDIAFWIRRTVYKSEEWTEMKEKWGCTPEEFENFLAVREGWRLCKEKTPEKNGWYLVRLSDGLWNSQSIPQKMATLYWDGWKWWDAGFIEKEYCEAWMPLPAT